jgi:Domain of unknown function (DUF4351)
MANSSKARADQDSPWKLVLRQYFPEAIAFFFPHIAKEVDWTKPVEFLDKEFQQITPDAEMGRRFADQLVKVYRKSGKAILLLIHLEVQAAPEKDFAERMFTYAIRIFEYFRQFPVSLAILCDGRPSWRPTDYRVKTLGSTLRFDFTAVKLLDYQGQWAQLEASRNPFAVVVMAHLKMQETQKDADRRKVWKMTLVKRLYELGYSRSDVLNLFKFIDWAMMLPDGLKRAFWEELSIYEEERQMPYMTSVEEIGYDRGLKIGKKTGVEEERRALILLLLTQKFGQLSEALSERVSGLSPKQLQSLAIALLRFESIDELSVWLDKRR